jgi:putative ABC transport system substrate-binding protein
MRRREFIRMVGGALMAWPLVARAQEPGRTYRMGWLAPFPRDAPFALRLLDVLRQRGFIDGQNLAIDYRDYGARVDLVSEYAVALAKGPVDVIQAGGGNAVRTVQQATKTIPICGASDDMVGEGLVNSMAQPTGNTTGVSILASELNGKRQEILIDAVPGIRRMGALADSRVTTDAALQAMQEAARQRNVEVSVHPVAKGGEIAAAIDTARASGATALNVLASPMLYISRQLIMDRVAALRMPAIFQWPEMAEEGGFAAYGSRLTQLPELVARPLVKLLLGAKPADIPVEQPTKFELVINLKTAQALGLTLAESFLVRADKVIE